MVCNLCDADLGRPGQLAAAPLGDSKDKQSESALAGTLVSSLHRLKDIDNSGVFDIRHHLAEGLLTTPQMAASLFSPIFLSRSKERFVSPSVFSK